MDSAISNVAFAVMVCFVVGSCTYGTLAQMDQRLALACIEAGDEWIDGDCRRALANREGRQ